MNTASGSPSPPARPRWSGPVAVTGFATFLVMFSAGGKLEQSLARRGLETQEGDIGTFLAFLLFAVVAAVLIWLVPRNPVSWVFFGIVLLGGGGFAGVNYALYHAQIAPLPAGRAIAWIANWSWYPTLSLMLAFLPLYFPTGRLLSPRWRWVAGLAVGATLAVVLRHAFGPGELDSVPIENPLGIDALGPFVSLINAVLDPLFLATILLALASSVARFRRSRGQERQQMKWFVLGLSMFIAFLVVSSITGIEESPDNVFVPILFGIGFSLIPVSAGLAILKYRLYAIDTVINRILVYGLLTVLLVGAYLITVVGLQVLLQPVTSGSDLVVAASTLAVAAIFRPLRNRVQHFIDRRFYRRKYNAAELLARFAGHLRQEVDLDSVQGDVLAVVRKTMQPQHASLWVKAPGTTADAAGEAS